MKQEKYSEAVKCFNYHYELARQNGDRWSEGNALTITDSFEQYPAKAELCNIYAEAGIHCLELRQPASVLMHWSTNGLKAASELMFSK